jgi:hypothetical protein
MRNSCTCCLIDLQTYMIMLGLDCWSKNLAKLLHSVFTSTAIFSFLRVTSSPSILNHPGLLQSYGLYQYCGELSHTILDNLVQKVEISNDECSLSKPILGFIVQ